MEIKTKTFETKDSKRNPQILIVNQKENRIWNRVIGKHEIYNFSNINEHLIDVEDYNSIRIN